MELLTKTQSLCPECLKVIPAELFEHEGKVLIRKSCPEHGEWEDTYWSSVEQWKRARQFTKIGDGLENPRTRSVHGCPYDCGICPQHKSHTVLAIIDVTNRCNLTCPICFANANAAGYVYEPTFQQICQMIDNLAANRPVSVKALQLSGGEPTLRDDLPDIVKKAKEVGIRHIEVNTNGVRIAKDKDFLKRLLEAGVSSFYLQFDSVKREPYIVTRGVDLLDTKLQALENLRQLGHDSTVLVMTLVKGVNDDQLGDLVKFAAKNSDIVRCVNVQPVSITGRIDRAKLKEYRITIPDFMGLIENQTDGQITENDFYPVPTVVPFAKAVGALQGKHYPEFTMHEHCGMATFVFVKDGKVIPITRYADVDALMQEMNKVYELASSKRMVMARLRLLMALRHTKFKVLRDLVGGVVSEGSYEALGKLMRKIIMIGAMHFMDPYNFDLERVQRCGIHYAVPDGRIIPFCTMNTLHRVGVEKQLAKESTVEAKIRTHKT